VILIPLLKKRLTVITRYILPKNSINVYVSDFFGGDLYVFLKLLPFFSKDIKFKKSNLVKKPKNRCLKE